MRLCVEVADVGLCLCGPRYVFLPEGGVGGASFLMFTLVMHWRPKARSRFFGFACRFPSFLRAVFGLFQRWRPGPTISTQPAGGGFGGVLFHFPFGRKFLGSFFP